jgi:phosphotransferase system enzyme I (PtsP)
MRRQSASSTGSRRLLKRVRDVMAAPGAAQERFDRVVRIIAAEMVAEVCSAYILCPGDILELYATEGLRSEAVHRTRLSLGEGLVGEIAAKARALTLSDAQSHPNFAYRPETGEEIYHSLMGVPLLRSGRALGVLVVQNRTRRQYTDEEIETLQTVAMVLTEVVASGELVTQQEVPATDDAMKRPLRLEGIQINAGLAIGVAVLHEPVIAIGQMVADDPDAEIERLTKALRQMHSALDDMLAAPELRDSGEPRDVLETYRMFAEDRGWLGRIEEAIVGGLSAEAAVRKVQDDMRARMRQVSDLYFRERLYDLDDLNNRLLRHLTGGSRPAPTSDLPRDAVVVASSMGPAELMDYERRHLRALILEEGTPTAHVTIVARALDIPVLGQVPDAMSRIRPLDPVIVDADHGQLFVRPGEDIRQAFAESMQTREERRAAYAATRDLPAVTRDGVQVSLKINAGLLIDLQHLHASGADGVGLYRTEIPFMVLDRFPDVETQTDLYGQVLDLADGKPVVFRTLDIGGDKLLPYWRGRRDGNPAMGWRAIRVALDRPSMLQHQLRALIRAAAGRDLQVMFPMITEVREFEAARAILAREMVRREEAGVAMPTRLQVGVMIEVPALVWQLPALLPKVDFVSIGSNDLLQFLFAADRGNPQLAGRYDVLCPAALSFLRFLVEQCRGSGVPVTLCGEMAGDPLEAMALIGLGFRSISTPPPAIGPVKTMTRSLAVEPLREYMLALYDLPDHSVRETLRAYAHDHGVFI